MLDIKTLENWLWEAACKIRGPIDAPKYKDYILPLIFLKRLSDVFEEEVSKLAEEYGNRKTAEELVENDHSIVWFYLPKIFRTSIIIISIMLSSFYFTSQAQTEGSTSKNDTIARVTGIGGIFFLSDDPQSLKEWYGKNLGLEIDAYGSVFEFRNANRPDEVNYLRWSPFDKKSDYLLPSKKEFMVNYRVQNLDLLVQKLKANGVTLLDSIEMYEYGKFVHILDIEGNKIELWEAIDSVLTKMGGKTTK